MPKPNFDSDELYLIHCVKSGRVDTNNFYMWHYLIGGFIMALFGVFQENIVIVLCAFGVVAFYRVYEERHYKKYIPVWKSLIEKYEAAIPDDQAASVASGKPEDSAIKV